MSCNEAAAAVAAVDVAAAAAAALLGQDPRSLPEGRRRSAGEVNMPGCLFAGAWAMAWCMAE